MIEHGRPQGSQPGFQNKIPTAEISRRPESALTAKNAGCVVRALASAAGVKPTDLDYSVRLGKLDGLIKEDPHAQFNLPDYVPEETRDAFATMDDLSLMDTPLGRKLCGVQVRVDVFPKQAILSALDNGEKVILDMPRHWAHIEKDTQGTIVSKSDNGEPINFAGSSDTDSGYLVVLLQFDQSSSDPN